MPFDFSKLRGRIVERFGNCRRFAAAMGESPGWISVRLNNVVPWGADEIKKACEPELLDIDPGDIPTYFFTPQFR